MTAQQLSQVVDVKLRVAGGAVQVSVSQDLSDMANVGAASDQVRGKRMAFMPSSA